MPARELVLWGATGFTGRLVAEHVASNAPPGMRWAIAGRDRTRLERVRDGLARRPDVLVADAHDRPSLDALVRGTRVVASTVGPFARHGTPLVECCVEHGVAYADITGEPDWIRDNVDRLHARAEATGSRIVHACGFDSIPSDLGVLVLHDHLSGQGRRLARARLYVERMRGGFSGGTIASMLDLLERASRDRAVRRVLADPYALNPAGERHGPDAPDLRGARRDAETGRSVAPFMMAAINTRVVRRSNALLGWPYGHDFRYDEVAVASGPLTARLLAAGIAGFAAAGSIAPTRALLRRLLPSPGEGPDAEARERGSFEISIRGHAAGDPPLAARVRVRGEHDPGYGETSRMLAEAALALALDDLPKRGGILTPASALGLPLVGRLRAAGMTFEATTD